MHGNDESEEMSEMEQQVMALTGLLEEGLVSQEKYDILVVKILSGEMPDLLGDSEETMQGHGDDDDYDDRSMASRSSSLFNVHDGPIDELSSDEEDENLKNNIVMSNMGFSALYKQNSLVELRDNPSEVNPQGAPLPPLPPPSSHSPDSSVRGSSQNAVRKQLNMVMMGAKPKNAKKKQLASTANTEAKVEDTKSKSNAKRGFFRQASSFEAAKYNPSLAAGLKKNQFDVIMIDGNEFPPPADPPPAGDIPLPPPLQLPSRGSGGGRIPPVLESAPGLEDVEKSKSIERISQAQETKERPTLESKERSTLETKERPAQETMRASGVRESERDTNRETSVTSMTSLSLDESYKNKQFAMKPELLSAALKKRSQWTLNRHDSNEFYS